MNMSVSLNSDSDYAKRRQAHVSLINQLRAIGAQADLDLPRVVVIGNQSAGKSSLVEAISGITVPRDAGTCTRCPIECRMSHGSQWSCQVSIRWEFATDGSTDTNVREVAFGSRIHDKGEVELVLRRAQAAVLNPAHDVHEFVDMPAKQLKHFGQNELQFSRNAVCVDLTGPNMTDLAFIDLPGIIQNAQPETVHMVEQLVSSHISGNCIVLVTLPMSDDIENQKAMQLAKQADPTGARTVGVLTKPDTIPPGATKSKQLWLDVIEGRRFPLKLGYFCTRQPDEDERAERITLEGARAIEAEFFSTTAPWSHSTQRHHFGTENLVNEISGHLTRIIDECLPRLMDETKNQLASCDARLAAIPPITSEPFAFILDLVQTFCTKIRGQVQGGVDAFQVVQDSRAVYRALMTGIRRTAPLFVPYTDSQVTPSSNMPPELQQLEDGEEGLPSPKSVKQITITQIQTKIKSALTRELPNNVPYIVKLMLIKEFQSGWERLVLYAGEEVFKILQTYTTSLIHTQFGKYGHLKPHVSNAVETLLEAKRADMVLMIKKLLKFESTAFTQNEHYLSDAKNKFLAQYKAISGKKNQAVAVPAHTPAHAPTPTTPVAAPTAMSPWIPKYDCPGTRHITNFVPCKVSEPIGNQEMGIMQYCNISAALPELQSWSPEELRVADYQQDFRVSTFGKAPQGFQGVAASPFTTAVTTPSSTVVSTTSRADDLQAVLDGLQKLGFSGVRAEDLQKLKPSSQYEEEFALMAEVRAYFKVSYKRIIDNVPLAIDHEFLFAFADELQSHLISALGLNGTDAVIKCTKYLAEEPTVVAERDELLARRKRLLGVQEELYRAGL